MVSERIGVVVGLRAEARIARASGWDIEIGGGTADGAARAAQALLARGAASLISFGLAGGLDPSLLAGAILVPDAVLVDGMAWPCDTALAARLGGPSGHVILGGDAVLASPAQKRAVWEASRAHAIDLESGAVVRMARQANVPFAVLRAICDPADRDLPALALVALHHDGTIDPWRVARGLLRAPRQMGALLRLARDAARARRSLMNAVARIA